MRHAVQPPQLVHGIREQPHLLQFKHRRILLQQPQQLGGGIFQNLYVRFGIFLQDGVIHVGKFRTAGNEHGQDPLLGAGGILPVVLQNAHKGHIAQNLFQFFLALAGEFYHVGHGLGLSHTHLQSHLCLLVG